jgi:hypothetical protein
MQPTDKLQKLKELALIYAKSKQMILRAEELDPESRSNVMVIKELRDSNDHLMRLFHEWFVNENGEKDEHYMLAQIDKARGHVFRAGYDAIDGIVVGYKVKAQEATKKISNGAISDVFPEYYTRAAEADILSDKIANHRENKDVADDSLENLEAYANDAAEVAKFSRETLARIPLMKAWDKKERKKVIFKDIVLVVILAFVGGVGYAYGEHLINGNLEGKSSPTPITNSVPTSVSK